VKLNLKTFSQLVQDMGAALQGSASSLVDVSVGSVVRALFEANASIVLWIQWLVVQVLSMTRAATSTGADLDSWMGDFGNSRLPATSASGSVTFSRFASDLSALVPVGTIAKTADGSVRFAVSADPTLSTWQRQSLGYVVPRGVGSVDLPVSCLTGGLAGNVLAGTITMIASSLPGIDQVVNTVGFTTGVDAESDQAFRTRFQDYLTSRSRATLVAIRSAIAGVQQGLNFSIDENVDANGAPKLGSFLITADDGSGYTTAALLSSIASAVDLVRPIGTTFAVVPPIVVKVDISLTASANVVDASNGYAESIQQQITTYLNSLPIGSIASATRVAQSAYSANNAFENISHVTLNGLAADVAPGARSVVKAGQIVVIVNVG
jgi:Baseplate J-like protein